MIENREGRNDPEEIRVLAERILLQSKDLIGINEELLEIVLLPKVISYAQQRRENNWLPPGVELSLVEEVGLDLFLDSINFCFKDPNSKSEYCYVNKNGVPVKRATGMWQALDESGVSWDDFGDVANISEERWVEMLQLSDENVMYLGRERRNRVTGLARKFLDMGMDGPMDLLVEAENNAWRIVQILESTGYFDDPFLKRAQLASRMISDIYERRLGRSLTDLGKLTTMADYRLPQVFYNLGVVEIKSWELMSDLVNNSPILSNSREENALRASVIIVGKRLAELMDVTEADIDGLLWGLSQQMVKNGEMVIPHMLVATDAY